ncbi:pentatricopeptide repeat-containing protein At3g14580, mitochondrial-like [Chenopodium quinoa]|uniref:pentatricopeptide repeat-containing protein At3g14580, mitochondrial-like n=1 Tax=Chenopodium quinoa TaxID=63459 RepID=UPI000B773A37|nr:pentatricopeptide repeat-containing protein At3g14580, mitochondrial-like [Chenopodium quinoa]
MLDHISKRKDYKPNESLFNVINNKLGGAKKFEAIDDILKGIKTQKNFRISDEFFYNVIKIYGNLGGLDKRVIEILFDMPEYNCWPSTKTFNFVLNFLVISKKFDVIYEVFLGATKLGVEIDACSLNILIKGLCKCGQLEDAYQVLDEFPKQGCKPNKVTYSTIMHCMCEKGMVDEAFGLINRMEKEGVSPDAVTFNILVSGLRKQGRIEEAMELLDRMRLMGCDPNKGTYQEVLYGLIKSKKFVDAKNFVYKMRSKSLIPSFLSYKLLVLGLCEENLLGDVESVLKSMVSVGFVPRMGMWRTVLGKNFPRHDAPVAVSFSEIVKD